MGLVEEIFNHPVRLLKKNFGDGKSSGLWIDTIDRKDGVRVQWHQDMPGVRSTTWPLIGAAAIYVWFSLSVSDALITPLQMWIGIGRSPTSWLVAAVIVNAFLIVTLAPLALLIARSSYFQKRQQTPVLAKVTAFAHFTPESVSWEFTDLDGKEWRASMKLSEIPSFEMSEFDYWFANIYDRGNYRNYFTIIVHHPQWGALMVAGHAGARSEMSKLHNVLTQELLLAQKLR